MPKEFIESLGEPPNSVGDKDLAGVEVAWGRDTYVQIATVRPDGSEPSGKYGWYVDLDRDQINRLIRNLRKARDQAYGADE